MESQPKTYNLIESKTLFKISLWVAALTVVGVYFWGLGHHYTFFENSIISTTILSVAFFLFITIGLYRGVKLKDNLGRITAGQLSGQDAMELASETRYRSDGFDLDVGEGIGGIIIGIILWILWAISAFVGVARRNRVEIHQQTHAL
jgi:hypothetical protein